MYWIKDTVSGVSINLDRALTITEVSPTEADVVMEDASTYNIVAPDLAYTLSQIWDSGNITITETTP